ncbi:MAG: hypothetical protein EOP11_11490 [Proteobacteria bacterium]|nr:MAG: hypothetical protein EOP11_11490 [Pseudomonadota bacterium]
MRFLFLSALFALGGSALAAGAEPTSSHEALLARYATIPAYQKAVDSFWEKDLSSEGRASVKGVLSAQPERPNVANLQNEFQAHLLAPGAELGPLRAFVPAMRKPLQIRLQQAGFAPGKI